MDNLNIMPAMQPTGEEEKYTSETKEKIRRFFCDYPDGHLNHEIKGSDGIYVVTVTAFENGMAVRPKVMASAICSAEEMIYDVRCLESTVSRAYRKAVSLLCTKSHEDRINEEETGEKAGTNDRISFTKGKYKGRPLHEVFLEDRQYIRYIAQKENCIEDAGVIEECRRLIGEEKDEGQY